MRLGSDGRVCPQARVLRALITRPDLASTDYVAGVVWGDAPDDRPDAWANGVHGIMFRLRARIARRGIVITVRHGFGYRLVVPVGVDIEAVFRVVRDIPACYDRMPLMPLAHPPRFIPVSISR